MNLEEALEEYVQNVERETKLFLQQIGESDSQQNNKPMLNALLKANIELKIAKVINNHVFPTGSLNQHKIGESSIANGAATATTHIKNESNNDTGYERSTGSVASGSVDSSNDNKRRFAEISSVIGFDSSISQHDDIIGGNFPNYHNFSNDLHKKHKCAVCNYETTYKYYLKSHFKRMHTDDKRYKCAICSHQCKKNKTYKKHMQSHGHEYPFECAVCKEVYENVEQLKLHEKNTKIYQCDICSRTFKHRKDHLERHMHTHVKKAK